MDKHLLADLKESLKQAAAISQGKERPARRIIFTPEEVAAIRAGRGHEIKAARLEGACAPQDVKAIREQLALSQQEFATLIQVNVRTLQNWEQKRRRPTGPAAALLKIVATAPEVALQALHR
ncbi:helix-turn-helix domain-containing protein [Desulfovibrio sp. OttesenSCG-928-G11]|nr:helix-turn-helix domain-containing protein [Desulfovibrio sp. OttesenSCG-928-G11]